ncbi:MAG TPA: hypothetical protein VKB96_05275 [Gammaproteobacteria bacterium]|nr:hypothetical protein [Gammaproteobacteria bacterium]
MGPFDIKRLSLELGKTALAKPHDKEKPPRHKPGEKFLKGPVPLTWLASAAQLPGKALHVSVVLWFFAGLKKTRIVSLPNKTLRLFGVSRNAKYRALGALEKAGLVVVERPPGRNPLVTLLDAGKPQ